MPYCTLTDILDQLPEAELVRLTDDAGAGVVDTDTVNKAITSADAEIDSYCGKRHTVPLDPVPTVINDRSATIAIYKLYLWRRKVDDDVQKAYDDAVAWLKGVAKGLVSLGEKDPDETPSPTHKPRITQSPRIFSRDKMEGF